jgi:hypothetical protein
MRNHYPPNKGMTAHAREQEATVKRIYGAPMRSSTFLGGFESSSCNLPTSAVNCLWSFSSPTSDSQLCLNQLAEGIDLFSFFWSHDSVPRGTMGSCFSY